MNWYYFVILVTWVIVGIKGVRSMFQKDTAEGSWQEISSLDRAWLILYNVIIGFVVIPPYWVSVNVYRLYSIWLPDILHRRLGLTTRHAKIIIAVPCRALVIGAIGILFGSLTATPLDIFQISLIFTIAWFASSFYAALDIIRWSK